MAILLWDQTGQRLYETGVDKGVLYPLNNGTYPMGYAWNGLTGVTESPSGAEATALYADNIKYLSMFSAEEFGATLEAYTYPDIWAQHDGVATPQAGVSVGQQTRKPFGLTYRTKLGNDVSGNDFGYKIHLVYGAVASPSEKAFATINDSPEAITFSWELTTTPATVSGLKPSAILTIDSTKIGTPANLTTLEDALYGTAGTNPRLPLPDEVVTIFSGAQTPVIATIPTFVSGTGVITIPVVTGVTYRRSDTMAIVTGTTTIAGTTGAYLSIYASPSSGLYRLGPNSDDSWVFIRS